MRKLETEGLPSFSRGAFFVYSAEFAYWACLDETTSLYRANVFVDPRRNLIRLPDHRGQLTADGWDFRVCLNAAEDETYRNIFWEELEALEHKGRGAEAMSPVADHVEA